MVQKKIINITNESLNTDRAYAFGLVIKLEYIFPKKTQPHLQIFLDNEEAKAGEWGIYGVHPDVEDGPSKVVVVKFTIDGEKKEFQLGDVAYSIQFMELGEKEVNILKVERLWSLPTNFQ